MILVLDGATGTNLQKQGLPQGVCVEKWILDNPEILIDLQSSYKNAGSSAVYAPTFGANVPKLKGSVLEDDVIQANKALAELSFKAVGSDCLVGGGMSPTGKFLAPIGEMTFNDLIDIYKSQVEGMIEAGVDFFVVETMMDIREALAALTAVKESSNKPCFVTMTFNEDNKTLTGTDAVTALITLQAAGAAAVGANCSSGPKEMLEVIKAMSPFALVPLIAKPNAGKPHVENNEVLFDLSPKDFANYAKDFIENGAYIIGGCCGTTPLHIEKLSNVLGDQKSNDLKLVLERHKGNMADAVTSLRNTVFIDENTKTSKCISLDGDFDDILDELMDIEEDIINISLDNAEKESLGSLVFGLASQVYKPFVFSGGDEEAKKIVLRNYPGRTKFI